jgi:hypothetical protein
LDTLETESGGYTKKEIESNGIGYLATISFVHADYLSESIHVPGTQCLGGAKQVLAIADRCGLPLAGLPKFDAGSCRHAQPLSGNAPNEAGTGRKNISPTADSKRTGPYPNRVGPVRLR